MQKNDGDESAGTRCRGNAERDERAVSGHCCDKCAVWENRLLSISGATKGLPTVDDAIAEGLFHPNCTHSLSEVDDYTREEEYNPDGTPKTGEEDEHDHSAAKKGPNGAVTSGGDHSGQYAMMQNAKPAETHEEHLTRRQEQLETARQNRVKREAKLIGAPLIQGEHTREDDLMAVNPNFVAGRNGVWENNCQRCVVAYELRRRGIDVTALPCLSDPNEETKIRDDWQKLLGNARFPKLAISKAADRKNAVDGQMLKWGEGSRATVYVQWNSREAHVFCAEVVSGKVIFVDPQSGEYGVERYFSEQKSPFVALARVDKLKIDDYSKKAAEAKK